MNVTISPSVIQGNLQAPASKSSMQRACAAALVSKAKSHIINTGSSNDDLAALRVIRTLGASIENLSDGSLIIETKDISPVSDYVNCGESGLGIRMFAPLVALHPQWMVLEGEGSLLGKLPLRMKGPLVPANVQIDGSLSSQFLTGLLMAYASSDAKNVSIEVNN